MKTRKSFAIVFLCGGLLAVLASCRRDGGDGGEVAPGLSDQELESILGKESVEYAKRSCEKLHIAEPIEVKDAAGYKDGGSRALMVVDANGIEYEFKVWHGFYGPMDISRSDRSGAPQRVELGGPEERDLYGVILRWILKHPQRDSLLGKEEIDPVKGALLHDATQFYFRMKRRIVPEKEWTDIGPKTIDRSWVDGAMTVSASKRGAETRIVVSGSWRNVKPGLKIRYNLWLVDKKGREGSRYSRSRPLETFKHEIASFPDSVVPSLPIFGQKRYR